jgi:hypothetical protein
MAEGNDTSSIWPLNSTAQKEGMPLVGMFLLGMVITFVLVLVVSFIANAL